MNSYINASSSSGSPSHTSWPCPVYKHCKERSTMKKYIPANERICAKVYSNRKMRVWGVYAQMSVLSSPRQMGLIIGVCVAMHTAIARAKIWSKVREDKSTRECTHQRRHNHHHAAPLGRVAHHSQRNHCRCHCTRASSPPAPQARPLARHPARHVRARPRPT